MFVGTTRSVNWPFSEEGPTIVESCHQRAPYLWLLAESNRHLKWREVAALVPSLVPQEHRKRYKWRYHMLTIWGMAVTQAIQRYCLREGRRFPYRER